MTTSKGGQLTGDKGEEEESEQVKHVEKRGSPEVERRERRKLRGDNVAVFARAVKVEKRESSEVERRNGRRLRGGSVEHEES